MTHDAESQKTVNLLESAARMVELANDKRRDVGWKLRRLTSIVVADFPRALFKLQVVGKDSLLRVVPEFVTPLLQQIVDRYHHIIGPLDVRDATLPTGEDSPIETGILSSRPVHINRPDEIERYYAAHLTQADRLELGRIIREDLRIREVLLVPVRPDDLPFGVVSISTTTEFGTVGTAYWRLVATTIAAIYQATRERLLESLRTLAFARTDQPTLLADAEGTLLDLNRAAMALLGYDGRESALRHIGNLKPCLPRRDFVDTRHPSLGAFYLADAYGAELACSVATEEITDAEGQILGAVVSLSPRDDLAERSLRLTRRQREVARLVAEGMTTKEVAARLGLSIHTVNYHRAQIREQLPDENLGDLPARLRRYFLGSR